MQLATSTSVSATQTSIAQTGNTPTLSTTFVAQTATSLALTPSGTIGVMPGAPTGVLPPGAPTPTLIGGGTPVTNAGCLGDEQMFFAARRPYVNTRVQISVTSQRHHNAQIMVLAGPTDTGAVTERVGLYGWVWTWTVTPTVEGFYDYAFFADGLHQCIHSGFNAITALGATPTPTVTNLPANTEGPTSTSTPTQPSISSINPTSGGCAQTITILGSGFGSPASGATVPSGAQVFFGGRTVSAIIGWSNTSILIGIPSTAPAGPNTITVSIPGGGFSQGPAFNLIVSNTPVTVGANTPTPTPGPTSCP
jgi:hypothetical protein